MAKRSAASVELFVSHSSKNAAFADRLVRELTGEGFRSFYSKKSIRGAQQWHDEIGAALTRCNWFLVLLSPDAVRADWVKKELLYALYRKQYTGRIVPILCKTCKPEKLSWTLPSLEYVDFRRSFPAGLAELLQVLRR